MWNRTTCKVDSQTSKVGLWVVPLHVAFGARQSKQLLQIMVLTSCQCSVSESVNCKRKTLASIHKQGVDFCYCIWTPWINDGETIEIDPGSSGRCLQGVRETDNSPLLKWFIHYLLWCWMLMVDTILPDGLCVYLSPKVYSFPWAAVCCDKTN